MDLYSAFHYFRNIIGYEQYRLDNCTNDKDKVKETFAYVQEHLRGFKFLDDFVQFINQFDEINNKCQRVQVKEKGIYVMTFHASKGLEFDNVLIPHLIDGEVPSSKSVTNDNIEEERRMLYVAFTRAKKRLLLSYVKDENNKHMMSRFLYDIINDVEFIKC